MAWALIKPTGYGEYFPDGGVGRGLDPYIGWKEQIKNYYDNEMSGEEKRELGMEERISYWEFSRKNSEDKGPMKPFEQQKEYRAVKTFKTSSSLINLGGVLAVNKELKSVIEEFEPGMHQFWPIKITMPKKQEFPVQFYGMLILQWLDSFIPEQSEYRRADENMTQFWADETKVKIGKLSFSSEQIGGAHLWREKKITRPYYYISDALQSEIVNRQLKIFRHHPVREV